MENKNPTPETTATEANSVQKEAEAARSTSEESKIQEEKPKKSVWKRMVSKINFTRPQTGSAERFLVSFVAGFCGMIIALAWNNVLTDFVGLLQSFPVLKLFGGLVAAIFITVIILFVAMSYFNHINIKEEARDRRLLKKVHKNLEKDVALHEKMQAESVSN